MKNYLSLLTFLSLFVLLSCGNDDDTSLGMNQEDEDSYIQEIPFLGCSNYQTTDLSDLPNFNDFAYWNDLYFFDAFDQLIVREDDMDGETIIEEDMQINGFYENGNKMMICAYQGIYEVSQNGDLSMVYDGTCYSMAIHPDGSVLFATDGSGINAIMKLNGSQATLYTNSESSDAVCSSYESILVADPNNIFATTCDQTIIHFQDQMYVNHFNGDSLGLPGQSTSDGFYVLPYENGLIVVAENGTGYYMVLKYTADKEWITLKFFDGLTGSQKDIDMVLPSLTDALIYEDKLYISTTLASCRGIHYFDITKNETLSDEDYGIIEDPGFESQCISQIIESANGQYYVITGQSHITTMDCN